MATGLLFLLAFRPVEEIDLGTAEFYERSLRNLRRSVAAPGPPSGSDLLAGANRVSIAPPLTWDVPLGGNRRALVVRANGTHPESVFVRSIALSNGGRKLILTSADILTWNRELAARTLLVDALAARSATDLAQPLAP